ncbi:hypothetical protein CAC42_7689 [Sphaceloma murrayae]|uniref:Peptidase A1 domain-containing protein n=1 Tax=Sphaceloma murrayae TaxID=2082308 RepID=A0A2K1QXD9_9PEZI|nr:hypothetical protein CAC42_7689 [Sphaceloma murrayae]
MAKAINIAASQYWEGNDGPWSTFAVQIGNPPQTVRVLPSSSGSSIWAVLPEGCTEEDPADCATRRGVLFDYNNSTTWRRVGNNDTFFELSYETEASLGYEGNAVVGFDDVELGWPGAGGPVLQDQVIAGYAAKTNMLGLLGLTPRPVNITSYIDRHQSPLGTLANTNKTVPSSYWAYTAGARYRTPKTQASLVFGGFDTLRGDLRQGLTVPMGTDTNRDLVVAINGISITTPSTGANVTVSGLPIIALIDSVVPDIWLPLAACQAFESAFGLIYNDTSLKYFINETQHTALLSQNSSVTFSLSTSTTSTSSSQSTITLPYAAFDLTAAYPFGNLGVNDTSLYFPLQRAANSTQFTLGRTFLQESYLGVDYARNQFHLAQALFPQDPTSSNLISVNSPGSSSSSSSLPLGAIIGIAVGSSLLLAALFGLGFWKWRRRRAERLERQREEDLSRTEEAVRLRHEKELEELEKLKPELDATTTAIGRERGRWELEAGEAKTPWSGTEASDDADEKYRSPLGGWDGERRHEVPDHQINEAQGNDGAVEMKGEGVVGELDSSMRVEMDGDHRWRDAVELPTERYD